MPRSDQYVNHIELARDDVPDFDDYPFCIPAIRDLTKLTLHPAVTFLVGENGLGKSTLLEALAGAPVDLVMSDMAPNISGVSAADQPRAMLLVELALELARQVLRPGGSLLVKAFQGAGFQEFVVALGSEFGSVRVRKPAASRARSREVYLLARNYRM